MEVVEHRINWRKTLLSVVPDEPYTKKSPSAREVNAARQMACKLKTEGKAAFTVRLNEDGDMTVDRIQEPVNEIQP